MAQRGIWFALVMSSALAIVACSPGGSSGTGAPASAVSTPPSSVRTGLLTQEFATPVPSDTAQAEVIAGFREAQVLWATSTEQGRLVPPVSSYVTGAALGNLEKAISKESKGEFVPAGVVRFFLTRVAGLTGSTATVTACDDASKLTFENPTTRVVDPALTKGPADDQYAYVTWHMTRVSGHWAMNSLWAVIAKPCLPT